MSGYDNPRWEHHLPVNPPGAYFREGFDVMMTEVDLGNWYGEGGYYEYRPRLRDSVQLETGLAPASDDDAPELDWDYGYDCD